MVNNAGLEGLRLWATREISPYHNEVKTWLSSLPDDCVGEIPASESPLVIQDAKPIHVVIEGYLVQRWSGLFGEVGSCTTASSLLRRLWRVALEARNMSLLLIVSLTFGSRHSR